MNHAPRLEDVLAQARLLSALDKVRLIEQVAPEIEAALASKAASRSPQNARSLLGVFKDLGPVPTEEEIAEMRREAWSGLPREL